MVMILGNVNDERCFSILSFTKSTLQPTNSSFGFGCENVYTRALLFGYLSFWGHMKDWVENKLRYVVDCRTFVALANSLKCKFSLLLLHL
jgi:hypothetical protein